jgi:hypothetical protein
MSADVILLWSLPLMPLSAAVAPSTMPPSSPMFTHETRLGAANTKRLMIKFHNLISKSF